MDEEALSSRLSTSEKLLVSQAVYKLGALDWEKISGLLVNHPVIEGRPADWFDTKTCEAYYVGLMTEAGINVPAQDASRPQAKVHLRLAQKFYLARLQELKTSIAEYEHRFATLMSEIAAIKSGSMDQGIKEEIRGSLTKKFGKKLLDSWVPDEGAVKEAVEAGPPTEEELRPAQAKTETEVAGGQSGVVPEQLAEEPKADVEVPAPQDDSVPMPEQVDQPTEESLPLVNEKENENDEKEVEQQAQTAVTPVEDVAVSQSVTTPPGDEDVEMEEEEEEEAPAKQLSPVKGRFLTPVPIEAPESSSPAPHHANVPSSPASDLSPAPDDDAHVARPDIQVDEKPVKAGRASKRKASMQPQGPAASKRSRRKTATPAIPEPEPTAESVVEQPATEKEDVQVPDEKEQEAVKPTEEAETPKQVVEEEEPPTTRGRRTSKRESLATSRSKRVTSPASSSKHTSPQPQPQPASTKRATSASSAKSATPVEERRSSRRAPKGRVMRDEVVSKSVREQTVESVKEEEGALQPKDHDQGHDETQAEGVPEEEQAQEPAPEAEREQAQEQPQEQEQERPPTRSSRRVKDNTTPVPDVATPLPDLRKGTRRSSTRGGAVHTDADDEKSIPAPADETPKEKKQPKRPRHSSPRESKAAQRMLNQLLDQISGHRNGNVFAQPVRASTAPDYHKVIKRPMDLKTIRTKIRDGQITTIEEFQRDINLMFANATMFNAKGSPVHNMAIEMMLDAEVHISHLKSVQAHLGR